jgi:hypothetical protein
VYCAIGSARAKDFLLPISRTHYDNLKIARNAPIEVIEAAYRALVRKYHPDRNLSVSATRVMRIVNAAYEVLSDPAKRRQHDEWIAGTESRASPKASGAVGIRLIATARTLVSTAWQRSRHMAPAVVKRRVPIAVLALVLALVLIQLKSPNALLNLVPTEKLTPVNSRVEKPNYVLNAPIETLAPTHPLQFAPNGKPWPVSSGYVLGGPKHSITGLSTVTIDNTAGSFDAFVKIVFNPEGRRPRSVSWLFVRAGDPFTVTGLRPGRYAMYYQDLATGETDKSPIFQLDQDDKEYSIYRITLYTRVDGTIQMHTIGLDEFNTVDSDVDILTNIRSPHDGRGIFCTSFAVVGKNNHVFPSLLVKT